MTEETDPTTHGLDSASQRRAVRERYGAIARSGSSDDPDDTDQATSCCVSPTEAPSEACCVPSGESAAESESTYASMLGYTDDDIEAVDDGANLGLGCGNPTAIANLSPGETVLDLGAGAGFDCFLAARAVGPTGEVIGVDMTPEMVERARENAERNDFPSVEFRLGEIEHLPVADGSVDIVISNCVLNLSPDQPQVYREAFRVLRPGGRISIADVVRIRPIPKERIGDRVSVSGCVAGAASVPEVEAMLRSAGFVDIGIEIAAQSAEIVDGWESETDLSEHVASAQITAVKPAI